MQHLIDYWHLYLMAAFYGIAGIQHFRKPWFFIKITPPWVPKADTVNIIVGVIEVAIAIGLVIPATRSIAAWVTIALLIAVFPANWYHHQKARKKGKMVKGTLIRLPIQLLLIWWAWAYT